MKKINWSLILGFIILALIGFGIWFGGLFFIKKLLAANPTIAASIVGAMATVFVSLAVVIINHRQTRLRDIAEAHRTKKVELHEKYLKTIVSLLLGENNNVSLQPPTEQELIDSLVDYKRELLLWGSPEVIKRQLEFDNIIHSNKDIRTIILAVDNLYKAIRDDIGLSNSGLDNCELAKIFIIDRDEVDKLVK